MAKQLIDLHAHTTVSDGSLTPTELIDLAVETGLRAIALTDHDTMGGLKEFVEQGNEQGIETVPGIEISSLNHLNSETHILGYFIDPGKTELEDKFTSFQSSRTERNHKMIELFQQAGFDITYEEWEEEAGEGILGRPHLADLLIKKKICKDKKEVFGEYIGNAGKFYVPKEKLNSVEAVRFLKENKICPVLAHPGLYNLEGEALKEMLTELKDNGLFGVEVYHSGHSQRTSQNLLEMTFRLGLVPTGGSDFHGSKKPNVVLGVPEVPYSFLEDLRNKWEKGIIF